MTRRMAAVIAKPRAVVLYARLSENPNEKTTVPRHLAEGREWAAANGYTVAAEFSDDDISAYHKKRRPGFDAMMDYLEIHADEISGIVVFHTSRLVRRRIERAELIETLAEMAVNIYAIKGPSFELNSATGRLLADLLGAFDTAESAFKSERVKNAVNERVKEGKASSICAFGWRRENVYNAGGYRIAWKDVEDLRAADIVREIVKRLNDGETLHAITRDLNNRRIPLPKENREILKSDDPNVEWVGAGLWRTKTVSAIATRPANIGRRVVGAASGETVPAEWPAIVDETDHARVVARFASGVHPAKRERPTDRRWLLSCSEFATCGICGGQLASRFPSNAKRAYFCKDNHCTQRGADTLDAHVSGLVLAYLEKPANRAALLDGDSRGEDLAALVAEHAAAIAEQTEMGAAHSQGHVTLPQLIAFNKSKQPEIDAMAERIRRASSRRGPVVLGAVTPDEWVAMPLERQRLILQAVGVRVEIHPTRASGRAAFRPADAPVWIGGVRVTPEPEPEPVRAP